MRTAISPTPHTLNIGEVLDGRYRVIRSIARGSTGSVFLGEQTLTKRRVAIKVPHLAFGRAGSRVVDYMTEAFAVGTLGHPNIVEVIDTGVASGRPYIVYEYIEGCLLAQEAQRSGGMPLQRAIDIALQIASALDAAHTAGIVHLELHAANVMLTERGASHDHVKVLDFGCAHLLTGDRHRSLPPGLAKKAPELIAPEQIYTRSLTDPRTDIYALGCCLYEMLAARRPFRSGPQHAALQHVLQDPPLPLKREIPRALRVAIFERMLAKDPSQRFASIRAAMDALDWVARGLPADPIVRDTPVPHAPARGPAPSPAHRGTLFLGALLALALGSGAGYLYTQAEGRAPVGTTAER